MLIIEVTRIPTVEVKVVQDCQGATPKSELENGHSTLTILQQ